MEFAYLVSIPNCLDKYTFQTAFIKPDIQILFSVQISHVIFLDTSLDQGYGGWVAKLVERPLATAALWFRIPDIFQKYKMGDISKGVANTL